MKKKVWSKLISFLLVIATLVTTLPLSVFAEEINTRDEDTVLEAYLKEIKLVQASSVEEARYQLTKSGYMFLDVNLNEGTGKDGIWMGYLGTTDPTEAIYDIKVLNMNGGFTRTNMEEALAAQKSALAEMAADLKRLVDEFVVAYRQEQIPAMNAYTALNFFRVVNNETELQEENGFGYQLVNGGVTLSMLTEILLFCDPTIVDTIVKLLTMGIQRVNDNWLEDLSDLGPYDSDASYMDDEEELLRRAEQLLGVLRLYSEVYNAMLKSGLMPDDIDDNFNPVYNNDGETPDGGATRDGGEGSSEPSELTPDEEDLVKFDESRYKFYKIVEEELSKYTYGEGTLKDFFVSLATEDNEKAVYPLVSVLSDAEFSALSYGCFLEMVCYADATEESYESFGEVYETLTEEQASIYLYTGVDDALFDDEAIVAFTDEAQRFMAQTGNQEFFEKDNVDEQIWGDGTRIVSCIGAACLSVLAVSKISVGLISMAVGISTAVATAAKSGALAATLKYGMIFGGLKGLVISLVIVGLALLVSYVCAIIGNNWSDNIDWSDNPLVHYMYDIKSATFKQTSDDGVETGFSSRTVYALYEAVTDLNGNLVDMNAFAGEGEWLQMFVSYDRQGDNAKPIKYDEFLVKHGDGQIPEGYEPVQCFGTTTYAYNLNAGDLEDSVGGIYLFYKQDKNIVVDSGKTYYVSEVLLQTGKSSEHCRALLQDKGYTVLDINLSPDLTDDDIVFEDKIYTYLGYRTSSSESDAIRDIRLVYGPNQGAIQYGAATYAECGSNGVVTLYATKYEIAGTPILAGGIKAFTKQADAPAGYEPVCLMAGGPAVPVNVTTDGQVRADNGFIYLYFLPKVTFTSGKQYLGGIAAFDSRDVGIASAYSGVVSISSVHKDLWYGYVPVVGRSDLYASMIAYYPTYNPYRAIYSIKGAKDAALPSYFTIDGNSYCIFNEIEWGYAMNKDAVDKDLEDIVPEKDYTLMMQVTDTKRNPNSMTAFYLSGNPKLGNVYDVKKNQMSIASPIEISDVLLLDAYQTSEKDIPENFYPVVDSFKNEINFGINYDLSYYYSLVIYTKQKNEEKKYVSGINAIDQLTLYRANGGAGAGIVATDIPDDALNRYLINAGSSEILGLEIGLFKTHMFYGFLPIPDLMSKTKFGVSRTSKKASGLTDMFLYFNGFSMDEPPKQLYRGSVKYTMICKIPYNMMGDEAAPQLGVYLYGTTSTKAGGKIVDFQISRSPFMDGYETVRTMGGRSLVSEIKDYAEEQMLRNPIGDAAEFYEDLGAYFDNDDSEELNTFYYLHIRREEDTASDKLYIDKLYTTNVNYSTVDAIDDLFDQGADGYFTMDLNQGAGGDCIYLGYSYTEDPSKAIKEIRTYHENSHPATLTDDDGRTFTLVSDLDLNKGAGGDYIYLYTSKGILGDNPITGLKLAYSVSSGSKEITWVDGTDAIETTHYTKMWDSSKKADLNDGAGGEYIYLMYMTVTSSYVGKSESIPNYGQDKTFDREGYEDKAENGKYIGGLYVMDKETIRLEKIASGELSSSATCNDISDQEVFDSLTKMGATTIIKTPISASGSYFGGNKNKAYIGYSRTDNSACAIRGIAICVDIMSHSEPKENIDVGNKPYTLVAEAAEDATVLPKAVNLLAIENMTDLILPRFYLYYSTETGPDPIYDISIDNLPLINGWNTVRSGNLIDPFADIYEQATKIRLLSEKDETLSDSEDVYANELAAWMENLAERFNPADSDVAPFYIHVKRHTTTTLEELKPYISKIYIEYGESKQEALSKLIAHEPDGFIDVDLNDDAGGSYVYIAYKRTAKVSDALTDIFVYEGSKFEPSRRIDLANGESVKYTLVADIDLNKDAGGKYLYLYATDSGKIGNPIKNLEILEDTELSVKCGVERATVKRAEGRSFTNEFCDLNKGAGGEYIYLVMTRESTEGHTSDGNVLETIEEPATCVDDGYLMEVTTCTECSAILETIVEHYYADGVHYDDEADGDHDCDYCYEPDVSEHVFEGFMEEDTDSPSGYKFVRCCSDCGEYTGEEYPIKGVSGQTSYGNSASFIGEGSIIAICAFFAVMIAAGALVWLKKRKETAKFEENEGDNEN